MSFEELDSLHGTKVPLLEEGERRKNNSLKAPLMKGLRRTMSLALARDDDKPWNKLSWGTVFSYIGSLLYVAGPISITLAIENGETIVNLYWVKTFNNTEMIGGVGLGNMWTNTLGITCILAFDSALASLCA